MTSQTDAVLARLRRGPLTALQALSELGCFRLSARCWDLRQRGHKIDSRLVVRRGKHVSEYWLKA